MDTPAEQLDEASLAKRLEAQKEFVARKRDALRTQQSPERNSTQD